MAGFELDTSELDALAADLRAAPAKVKREATASLHRGANNIKREIVADVSRSRHFKIAPHIGYDVDDSGDDIEAQIGAAKTGAGSLMHIAVNGGRNGGGGTVKDPEHALLAEAPSFEKFLGDVGERLW